MAQRDDPQEHSYPTGRGYGHDYMRGGEVLGGYGYSARPDYQRRRGDHGAHGDRADGPSYLDDSAPQRPRRSHASPSPEHPSGPT